MKKLFTNNPTEIAEEINSLITNKGALVCAKGGTSDKMKKLPLVAKSKSSAGDLMVILHPDHPCDSDKCSFYYATAGAPLRYFEAARVKKAKQFLGLQYPTEIYNVFRRKSPRVQTARKSTITFSILHKQRVYSGKVVDISLNGAQLSIDLPAQLSTGDTLCALSFILCSRLLADYEETITLAEAKIVWIQTEEERNHTLGINFEPDDNARDALENYINLRKIEDPKDFAT
ncbi:MAG: PilZ domain-containing protein [Proteobacteria bacterium]|nr:PilZ domain-containing protein [Desulfobulbaceae bacterium]MBU4152393.1 PilZ domain-containing protein [Pseudomonadota bacterium]